MVKGRLKKSLLFLFLWIISSFMSPQSAFALGDYNTTRLSTKESFKINNSIRGEILIECPVYRFFDRIIDFGNETEYGYGTPHIVARKEDMKALNSVEVSLVQPNKKRLEIDDFILSISKKSDYLVIISGYIQIKAPWKSGEVYYHNVKIYKTVY